MKIYSILFLVILSITSVCFSQTTSSGKCYYNDYNLWNDNGQPDLYGDCTDHTLFNPGNELTMEVWVRGYTYGENRKIMGKLSPALNDGYVLGFQNLNVYSQIFNPDQQYIPYSGTGPMPLDSAWIHIATTFSSSGQMIDYINGENVGEVTVFPQNPISSGPTSFIIGRAPWDYAYLFYGSVDEVRIWNVQRSQSELQEFMHKELRGDEAGLVANYSFNNSTDSVFYDKSPNNLNGVIKEYGHQCFWWKTSYAPVGDSLMYNMSDINGAWYGKSPSQFSYALTNNGLSCIAQIQSKEFEKYLIFGHNDSSGTSTINNPSNAPMDFKRLSRVWYLNQSGNLVLNQMVFNLTEAAAGGTELPSNEPDSLYTLLKWDESQNEFVPIYSASTVYNNSIIFDNLPVSDGFYTLGYGSTKLAWPAKVETNIDTDKIKIYPIPASKYLNIDFATNSKVFIYNSYGRLVKTFECEQKHYFVDISGLSSGLYIVKVHNASSIVSKKILIN